MLRSRQRIGLDERIEHIHCRSDHTGCDVDCDSGLVKEEDGYDSSGEDKEGPHLGVDRVQRADKASLRGAETPDKEYDQDE